MFYWYDMFRNSVIICSPGTEYFQVSDTGKHNITSKSNPGNALSQHFVLKATLTESGFEVFDMPELNDHPNSVFTRDTSLVTPEGYIKLQMGLKSRSYCRKNEYHCYRFAKTKKISGPLPRLIRVHQRNRWTILSDFTGLVNYVIFKTIIIKIELLKEMIASTSKHFISYVFLYFL